METAASQSVVLYVEWKKLPSTLHDWSISFSSLDFQETAENSSVLVLNIMGTKNVYALEFACILGRNIKCSVIIIIIETKALPCLEDGSAVWESCLKGAQAR